MNESKSIVILGGGGHTKVLIECLLLANKNILGILDIDKKLIGSQILGVPIIGSDEKISEFPSEKVSLVNGIGSIRDMGPRRDLFKRFFQKGYTFENVIHPKSIVSSFALLGSGVQILAGTIIQAGAVIGDNVIINTGAQIDHDCYIGSHSHVAPGAVLSGGVKVGEGTHLGTGCIIIQNIEIGSSVLAGAGAVIIEDIPPNAKVRGVPAK